MDHSSELRDGQAAAKRGCRWFVLTLVSGLIATAALNYVVNPHGVYSTEVLPPLVMTSRADKVRLFRERTAPVETLILGSSRVMAFEPRYVTEKTGMSAFNAGLDSARAEDFLAFLRFVLDERPTALRRIILGVDVGGLSSSDDIDPRLFATPALVRFAGEARAHADRIARWRALLGQGQTIDAARSLWMWGTNSYPPPASPFASDGLILYADASADEDARRQQLAAGIGRSKQGFAKRYAGSSTLSEWRCELFETFVGMCRDRRVELTVFLTPFHPDVVEFLNRHTNYPARRSEVHAYLRQASQRLGFRYHDLSDIRLFGGSVEDWRDGVHLLEPNTRLILDRVLDDF